MFMDREALIHFIGGAVGGTAGTCITCPLEVVKTRMQSSKGINPIGPSTSQGNLYGLCLFSYIIKTEGFGALYKGLLPNLVGVAPSKAVYFYSYSTSKRIWNDSELFVPNSAIVHMVSAGSAGFVAASAVNPIWLVKTRLQLHHGKSTILQMIRRVYSREGIKGFYKGVTASYAGVSETVIQFVIYEYLRSILLRHRNVYEDKGKMAKVVRTRLREESAVKRGFFRTLYDLYKEGGRSMYRGLSVQVRTSKLLHIYDKVTFILF
ncbi:unnamed protein product [Angiostrongylus costaricensis]|uniref:Solute carrier family 25 member 36 n=1 Tax=Angiostrongylus costaricensis TaxID=334426 RepID=A0A0R3PWR7_ANGCS|nr:unnamed protein product [Angiostrongylus costaricensis]